MSLNKVTLIGNLGQDPEIKQMNNGVSVANLSLATSENWKDKSTGEKRKSTEWHRIVIYNENLLKLCENYLKKGSKIYIEGKLQTRKWTDASGVEKYTTEIVLKKFNGQIVILGGNESAKTQKSEQSYKQASGGVAKMIDDELPF